MNIKPQDWAGILKWIFFSAVFVAFLLGGLNRGLSCAGSGEAPPSSAIGEALIEAGYTPASASEKPTKPEGTPPGVKPLVSGSGIIVRPDSLPAWPDTLHVETSVVEAEGQTYVGVWVEGQPVKWFETPRVDWDQRRPSSISVIGEYAFTSGTPWGLGASWEPLRIEGLSGGIAATVAVDASWAAISLRASRRFGPVSLGASGGYQVGDGEGFHGSLSAGLAIDLQ